MSGKTHKGMAKRLKKTASGRVLHRPAGKRKYMSKKPSKTRRRLSKWRELSKGDLRAFERQYGKI